MSDACRLQAFGKEIQRTEEEKQHKVQSTGKIVHYEERFAGEEITGGIYACLLGKEPSSAWHTAKSCDATATAN